MRLTTLLSLYLAVSGIGTAATVTSSVTCSTPNMVVNGTNQCNIQNVAEGTANASTVDTLELSGNEVNGYLQAYSFAQPGTTTTPGREAAATATVSINFNLVTAGPARTGQLRGEIRYVPTNYGGTGSYSFVASSPVNYLPYLFPQPIQLGVPFSFNISASSTSYSGSDPNFNSAYFSVVYLDLRFYEADGTTPVALSETPEPGVTGLLGLGFSMVIFSVKKRLT